MIKMDNKDDSEREELFHQYNNLVKLLKEIEKERYIIAIKIMKIRKQLFGRI